MESLNTWVLSIHFFLSMTYSEVSLSWGWDHPHEILHSDGIHVSYIVGKMTEVSSLVLIILDEQYSAEYYGGQF